MAVRASAVRVASRASRSASLSRSKGEAFGTTTRRAPAATVAAIGSGCQRSSQTITPTGTPATSTTQSSWPGAKCRRSSNTA